MRSFLMVLILGFGLSAHAEIEFRADNPFPQSVRDFIVNELNQRCPAIVTMQSPAESDHKMFAENITGVYQDVFYAVLLTYNSFEGRNNFPTGSRGLHMADQAIQVVVKKSAFALNDNDLELADIQSSEGVCLRDPKAESN